MSRQEKRKRTQNRLDREKVFQLLSTIDDPDDSRSIKQIAADLQVGLSNAYRLQRLLRNGKIDMWGQPVNKQGRRQPRKGAGRKQTCSDADIEWLKSHARNHVGNSAKDFANALQQERGVSVAPRTVRRYLRNARFGVKVIQPQPIQRVSRRIIDQRRSFVQHWLSNEAADDRVRFYLDEFGVDDKSVARRGWGDIGKFGVYRSRTISFFDFLLIFGCFRAEMCAGRALVLLLPRTPPRGDSRRISVCATIGVDGLINWIPIVGGFKRASFCFYLRTVCDRITQLYPEQQSWVVMDNASVHKGAPVEEVMREFPNIKVKYNTAWSPQLNPIENAFSTWKHHIGKHLARSPEGGRHAVHRAIRAAAAHITPDKCANWYRHLRELWPYFLAGCPDPEEAHRHGDRSATAASQRHMHIVQQEEVNDYAAALNESYNSTLRANGVPVDEEDDSDNESSEHLGHGGETDDRPLIDSDNDELPDTAIDIMERTLAARVHTAPISAPRRRNRRRTQVTTEPDDPSVDSDAETASTPEATAAGHSPDRAGSQTSVAVASSRPLPQGHEEAFPPDMPGHPLHGRTTRRTLREPRPPSLP